jgi:uncharacterized RmlC-like cupin family protein
MLAMVVVPGVAAAQAKGADVYSALQLRQMAEKLMRQQGLRESGVAGEMLEKYKNDLTMLAVRTKSGGAELHAEYADILFVTDGVATLITGGTVEDAKSVGPGEVRGSAVKDGVARKLGKGDVIHISPNTPHQMLIADGHSLTYFVVKVKE